VKYHFQFYHFNIWFSHTLSNSSKFRLNKQIGNRNGATHLGKYVGVAARFLSHPKSDL